MSNLFAHIDHKLNYFAIFFKDLPTKSLAISRICQKLCMKAENDYTNEFLKFQ